MTWKSKLLEIGRPTDEKLIGLCEQTLRNVEPEYHEELDKAGDLTAWATVKAREIEDAKSLWVEKGVPPNMAFELACEEVLPAPQAMASSYVDQEGGQEDFVSGLENYLAGG